MSDARPDLDAHFDIFGVEAVVTLPGGNPDAIITTRVLETDAFIEPFPSNSGNFSLTKSRRRFALRLSDLDVTEILIGTDIAIGEETFRVDGTDRVDNEVAIVITRKVA